MPFLVWFDIERQITQYNILTFCIELGCTQSEFGVIVQLVVAMMNGILHVQQVKCIDYFLKFFIFGTILVILLFRSLL